MHDFLTRKIRDGRLIIRKKLIAKIISIIKWVIKHWKLGIKKRKKGKF